MIRGYSSEYGLNCGVVFILHHSYCRASGTLVPPLNPGIKSFSYFWSKLKKVVIYDDEKIHHTVSSHIQSVKFYI